MASGLGTYISHMSNVIQYIYVPVKCNPIGLQLTIYWITFNIASGLGTYISHMSNVIQYIYMYLDLSPYNIHATPYWITCDIGDM